MRVGRAGLFSPSGTEITVEDSIFSKNTADNLSNDWGINQQTNRQLTGNGGNYQYPADQTGLM